MKNRPTSNPDLHLLAINLMDMASRQWPDVFETGDVERVRTADDVLLVGLRVMAAVARRNGVSAEDIQNAVDASMIVPRRSRRSSSQMDPGDDVIVLSGMDSLVHSMDIAMMDPERRSRMPRWFLSGFWPRVLRELAMGGRMQSSDATIAAMVLEQSTGVRK